ncbi:MAG: phosphoribosyltransferase [Archaeoglobi archaeon]|nr:phosphoribosyltransferase [Archaeoglobi archaeon]MDK2781571.1 phosphoribosyltransferase [Archaeoglobi archaeon]
MLRIAVPSKGRIHKPALNLLERSGIELRDGGGSLITKTKDPEVEVLFARARDIPEYVQEGASDLGITGLDMVRESGARVEILLELNFGHAEMFVAVPESSEIRGIEDLKGKKIATEFPNIVRKFFEERGIPVEIVEVSGACEMTPYIGIADAIADLSSSGTTMKIHKLRTVERIMKTTAVLIGNERSVKEKGEIVSRILMSIEGVQRAEGMRYLMVNVPEESLEEVKKILPGASGPTVMRVEAERPMLAVHAVIHQDEIYRVIGKLKKIGGKDILVVPIERMIP